MGISASTDRWIASAQLVIESLPSRTDPGQVAIDLARTGKPGPETMNTAPTLRYHRQRC
jgi:hypothetical protein